MGKMKVHELAKTLGMTSNELIKKANDLGINVTSHMNIVSDEQIDIIKGHTKVESKSEEKHSNKKQKNNNNESNQIEKNSKKSDNKKEEKPVIIRREVIITEETEKKEVEKAKNNNVTPTNKERKKDYNIVYRDKPVKPMTVDELFGIKKETTVKKEENKKVESVKEIKKEDVKENVVLENKAKSEIKPVENKELKNNMNNNMNNQNKKNVDNNQNRNNAENNQNRKNRNFENNNNNNNNNNNYSKDSKFNNKRNNDYRNGNNNNSNNNGNNNYRNNNNNGNNDYRNNNRNNRYNNNNGNNEGNNNSRKNNDFRNQNNRNNNYNRQNDRRNGDDNRNGDNKFNNRNNNFKKKPLDSYGIEKNIKNIMSVDTVEKESVREYQNKAIDKQKLNKKYEEGKNKKNSKSKKSFNSEFDGGKLKDLKQSDKLSHMFTEGDMLDYYDLSNNRNRKNKKKNNKESKEPSKQKIFKLTEITIPENISVKNLATELKKTTAEVIKKLFDFGIMATINNELDFDTAYLVAQEFGVTAIKKEVVTEEDILFDDTEDAAEDLKPRPPVVVVMGHVDHGKTSLLDAIRNTNVIEGEAGGITQHIGAYKVNVNDREITFLDTPGHEAFTSMRARGAQITDIAILVVAANDGIMPQTVEAINHAKAANIPIIVAVNKIDLEGADVEKVKQAMTEYELVPEEWGGDTIFVPISAKYNKNIDTLLEMVLLVADMKELKANPNKQSKGVVIEARLDKSRGPVASVLVQRGTLDVGDTVIVGSTIGRIRQMLNYKGQKVKKAGPSTPVEIIGLSAVPVAGEIFYEVKDEKTARHLVEKRKRIERDEHLKSNSIVTIDNLFSKIDEANVKQLSIIIKADVQGSVEAVKQALEKLSNDEIRVKAIHAAAGDVNESDINLAKVSNAMVIAFNVKVMPNAKAIADKEKVNLQNYSIIYQAIEAVERAMKGLEAPVYEKVLSGHAEVRQIFKISNAGTIAGSFVLDGKITRDSVVKVLRDGEEIFEGNIATLKRFKDDVKEVGNGFECGIQIENYNDIKEGDVLEAYVMQRMN